MHRISFVSERPSGEVKQTLVVAGRTLEWIAPNTLCAGDETFRFSPDPGFVRLESAGALVGIVFANRGSCVYDAREGKMLGDEVN